MGKLSFVLPHALKVVGLPGLVVTRLDRMTIWKIVCWEPDVMAEHWLPIITASDQECLDRALKNICLYLQ